jgi:hypothetical protein
MMFERLIDLLSPFGESTRFSQAFNALADRSAPTDWVDDFLEHHQKVQRMKPPGGKAPWFERLDSGACMIRAAYRQDDVDLDNTEYVHGYRTVPLWSFAEDLRML